MKSIRKIWFIALAALLGGCSTIGSSSYSCSGIPNKSKCMSSTDVYHKTVGGGSVYSESDYVEEEGNPRDPDSKQDGTVERPANGSSQTDAVVDTYVAPALPDKPIPVRTPAKVMRIWVSSWEDASSGALITPGYIYTEVEPRKWTIGKQEAAEKTHGRLLTPLESPTPPHTP